MAVSASEQFVVCLQKSGTLLVDGWRRQSSSDDTEQCKSMTDQAQSFYALFSLPHIDSLVALMPLSPQER